MGTTLFFASNENRCRCIGFCVYGPRCRGLQP